MDKLDFDFDANGGLMPQIQALIAPPVSEEKGKKKETKHPYYRRPGKGHNHDCCDSCGEGGDLLCCDKCPASFHLLCHDPPLDEDDIPTGMWLCHSCKYNAQNTTQSTKSTDRLKKDRTESPATSKSSTPVPFSDSVGSRLSRRRDSEQGNSTDSRDLASTETPFEAEALNVSARCEQPLETLIKAATQLNPKEFELPYQYLEPIPLPGTEKFTSRRGKSKRKPHELDNGLVPLPAKLCHGCHKSCRVASLLACDYCPLLFHLDCLTPPLTTVPSGRWMCPAHPNHSVDQKLLQSCGATERLRLWDRYCTAPVDPEAVKIDFLRHSRISQSIPRKRVPRVKLNHKNTAKVPEAVRQHYLNPQPLVPQGCPVPAMPLPGDMIPKESTKEEQELWLASVLSLQNSIASHLSQTSKEMTKLKGPQGDTKPPLLSNGGLSNGDICNGDYDMDKRRVRGASYASGQSSKLAALLQEDVFTGKMSDLDQLDESLIRALALQRLQEIKSRTSAHTIAKPSVQLAPCISRPLSNIYVPTSLPAKATIYPVIACKVRKELAHLMTLRQLSIGLGNNVDIDLSKYGHCNYVSPLHALIFYDNSTKEYELINYSEHGTAIDSIFYCIEESVIEPYQPPQPSYNPRDPPLTVGARKILTARRRKWKCLSQASQEEPEEGKLKSLISAYEEIPDDEAKKEAEESRIRRRVNSLQGKCNCNSKRLENLKAQGPGWEGSALLKHGSHLKFGCLHFVFARLRPAEESVY
ncbi:PHD finger protein 12 [Cloeon dipterum]|uniref:PHD finger protein 12 n=1 Tax=Cloeon dipterum TaxID=197152 RepID=UPI0032206836